MSTVPMIVLNDGVEIPQLGLGTYQVPPGETADVTAAALRIGYRHVDTAQMYGNEEGVGEAVRRSGLDRDEVFVTSKLDNDAHGYDQALAAFDTTMERLGFDQLDLFLVHWPMAASTDLVGTWRAFEELRDSGRVRSIGVSNFEPEHLQLLLDETDTVPSVNQIEVHPYFAQERLRSFDDEHGIVTEAWSPIARGDVLDDDVVTEIADEVGRTPAQVVLRWHVQRGDVIFPKTVHHERMQENFELFDFGLDPDAVRRIDELDRGARRGPDPKQVER